MSSPGEVSSPISATGEVGQLPPPDLAAPPRRLAAFLIDMLILTALASPLLIPAGIARNEHREALRVAAGDPTAEPVAALPFWTSEWFIALALVLVFAVYRIPQVAVAGRSLGHRLLGLRVVTFTGKRKIGFGRASLRYLLFYGINAVPVIGPFFTFVNYLFCVFDRPYRQCLHDKAAGTFVLHPAKKRR